MTVIVRDQVILHIPKTGGNWVRSALENSLAEDYFMVCYSVSNPHLTIKELQALFADHSLSNNYLFLRNAQETLTTEQKLALLARFSPANPPKFHAFVRHPLSWWVSFWLYRQKIGWQTDHWIDSRCQSNNFSIFIENVLSFMPGAYCSMVRDFIGPADCLLPRVWKQERLLGDLVTILREAAIAFNQDPLENTAAVNVSIGIKPKLSETLAQLLLESENDLIRSYYSSESFR